MKSENILLMIFVLGIFFISLPAMVFADENETTNTTANTTTNATANLTANATTDFSIKITSPLPKTYYMNEIKVNVEANTTVDSLYFELDGEDWVCYNCSELEENINLSNGTYILRVQGTLDNITKNLSVRFKVKINEEEENESDDVDIHDVILGRTNHGMEVRLLQLYKSLTRNVEQGELILEEIDNQNISVDTDNLEDILDEAKYLNEKIKDLLEEEPVNVSTEEFVSLKAEAINLTFQFKRELYNILAPEQLKEIKDALREEFKDSHSKKMAEIEKRIKDKVRMHNMEQAMKMYNKFGFNSSELRERIESGNFSSKELKEDMKDVFKDMKKDQKQNALKKMNEERESYQKEKMSISGKRMGIAGSEIENILNNGSLTWEEKEAKLRILAQDRSRNGNQEENEDDDDNGSGKFQKEQDRSGKGFGGRR